LRQEKEYINFNNAYLLNNLDLMKSYFEKKNAIFVFNDKEEEYEYLLMDNIHSKQIDVNIKFLLKDKKKPVLKISISNEDEISEYELEDYANKIFGEIFQKTLEGDKRYIIRIYGRCINHSEIDIDVCFNWKSNLRVSSYHNEDRENFFNVDSITSSPSEQILFFDMEVNAFSVSAARSIAYNQCKEFYSILSVLLDLGISEYVSEKVFVLVDVEDYIGRAFNTLPIHKGLHDTELNLFVYDNLNGLIAFDDENKMIINKDISYTFGFGDDSTTIVTSEDNRGLDKAFRDRILKKGMPKHRDKELNRDIIFYNDEIKVSDVHIKFFRKLKLFEERDEKAYNYFLNACKLYNNALSVCANEPTMMIAYLISSIETLSKTEKESDYMKLCNGDMDKFIQFAKVYIDEKTYDEKFLKYIYGNIRSGHFHSGEFKFLEYNIVLNQSFQNEIFRARNKNYIKGREVVRYILISWIEQNILNLE
jgi:hypothetical protein